MEGACGWGVVGKKGVLMAEGAFFKGPASELVRIGRAIGCRVLDAGNYLDCAGAPITGFDTSLTFAPSRRGSTKVSRPIRDKAPRFPAAILR